MSDKIRLGIVGYGNIGRGVEQAIQQNPDMSLEFILTRRDPHSITPLSSSHVEVDKVDFASAYVGSADVAILCGGSATDLPVQGPQFAALFNTVDSYDTHAKIPQYFDAVEAAARANGHIAVISTGWDPGLFSVWRVLQESCLPNSKAYTFWGPGVSQGHSDAIRRVEGVADGIQYTVPMKEALDSVRSGVNPELSKRQMIFRDCYVALKPGADEEKVRQTIVNMPNYFADNDTKVTVESLDQIAERKKQMPHGGFVMTSGFTGDGNKHIMESSLNLDSNPEFTGNVLVAYARAAYRLNKEGIIGAQTVLDIAPKYLSPLSISDLRANKL